MRTSFLMTESLSCDGLCMIYVQYVHPMLQTPLNAVAGFLQGFIEAHAVQVQGLTVINSFAAISGIAIMPDNLPAQKCIFFPANTGIVYYQGMPSWLRRSTTPQCSSPLEKRQTTSPHCHKLGSPDGQAAGSGHAAQRNASDWARGGGRYWRPDLQTQS